MPVVARAALLAAGAVLLAAGCTTGGAESGHARVVVAATPLAGALARAAGAGDVRVIPAGSPVDPGAVRTADYLVYLDTDGRAARLRGAAGTRTRVLPVTARFTLDEVTANVTRLAAAFATRDAADAWLDRFGGDYSAISHHLRELAPIPPLRVVAEADLSYWAEFAGLKVEDTFSAGPLAPDRLTSLLAIQPDVVLVDARRPADAPRFGDARRVDLLTDPVGLDLYTVLVANADRLGKVIAS